MSNDGFDNPLISRYASPEMRGIWHSERRIELWRELWVWLAEAQQELGLPITSEQLSQLRNYRHRLNLDVAADYERQVRHDVMAHVKAYGDQCPEARGIIHWGATSCYVTDNSDLLLMRQALRLVQRRLLSCITSLASFARRHAQLPCLAYTHLQPAQPTTVGKRVCLWIQDLVLDAAEVQHRLGELRSRSVKGTTGTQASFLQLFGGDHSKVRQLEKRVAEKMGLPDSYPVTGQTYPRKVDAQILDCLGGMAQSLHKMATDLRLLAHLKEIEEPFEQDQIGSSAMAYKRNPMRSERVCALSRLVMSLQSSPAMTAATQWFERTLDDSANRRLVMPQAFLAIDAALLLIQNISQGLVVYPNMIGQHLEQELPFMATESILMAAVAAGGDRQHLHEKIRQHSLQAASRVKLEGLPNDLIDRLKGDPDFSGLDWPSLLRAESFVGRAPQQVAEFLDEVVQPLLDAADSLPPLAAEVRV
jgi:adenylosuccinate lyase